MVARADEAALLGAPEREAHAAAVWRIAGQSQRGFEHRGRAAAIVVDARPLRHAVEMRADDDQGDRSPVGSALGQHVAGRALAGDSVDREAHGGAAVGRDAASERPRSRGRRPRERSGLAQQARETRRCGPSCPRS